MKQSLPGETLLPEEQGELQTYLSSGLSSHCKAEKSGFFSISFHFELRKASSMAFDGLGHFPIYRIKLHGSHDTILL